MTPHWERLQVMNEQYYLSGVRWNDMMYRGYYYNTEGDTMENNIEAEKLAAQKSKARWGKEHKLNIQIITVNANGSFGGIIGETLYNLTMEELRVASDCDFITFTCEECDFTVGVRHLVSIVVSEVNR